MSSSGGRPPALRSPQSPTASSSTPPNVSSPQTTMRSILPASSPRSSPLQPSSPSSHHAHRAGEVFSGETPQATGLSYSDAEWNRLIIKFDRTSVRGSATPPPSANAAAVTVAAAAAAAGGGYGRLPPPTRGGSPSSPVATTGTPPGLRLSSYTAAAGRDVMPGAVRAPHSALSPRATGPAAAAAVLLSQSSTISLAGDARAAVGVRLSNFNAAAPQRDLRVPHSALSPRAVGGGGGGGGGGSPRNQQSIVSSTTATTPASSLGRIPPLLTEVGFVVSVAPYVPNHRGMGSSAATVNNSRLSDADRDAAAYLWRSDSGIAEAAIAAALSNYRGQRQQHH